MSMFHKKQNVLDEYLLETLQYYRNIGFFTSYKDLSNEILLEKIKEFNKEKFGIEFSMLKRKKYREFIDLFLLSFDIERVWLEDTNVKIHSEDNIFEKILMRFSQISGGIFSPYGINECYKNNSIIVKFNVEDHQVEIEVEYFDNIIDIGTLLKGVNEVIKESGYYFEVISLNNLVFVVMLDEKDKQRLMQERDVEFVSYDEIEFLPYIKMENFLKAIRTQYGKWRTVEFILFVIGTIDCTYLFYKTLDALAIFLVKSLGESKYFLAADKYYWVCIGLFVGIICGGYLSKTLLRIILKERNKGYEIYVEIYGGEIKFSRKVIKYFSIVMVSIVSIFIFMGMNWYIKFTGDEIIINPLWSIKQSKYEYPKVKALNIVDRIHYTETTTFQENFIEIQFDDGNVWSSNSEGRTSSFIQDREIIEFVSEKSGKKIERAKRSNRD